MPIKLNGATAPWLAAILAVLTFTFWLGGLSIKVLAQGDDIREHEDIPAHAEAALATNTLQRDVSHIKEEVAENKKKLEDIEEQMEEDKNEILQAIRTQ